jgi:hypothetical protein
MTQLSNPGRVKILFLLYNAQTDSEAHSASQTVPTPIKQEAGWTSVVLDL